MSHWYMKIAAKNKKPKSKGIISFDFDRTLLIPHYDTRGNYLYYGVVPNWPMIELFKQHQRDGYTVGIVTARDSDMERPGHDTDGWGNPHLSVADFCDQCDLRPAFIHFTNGLKKYRVLAQLGSQLHYDDDKEECRLLAEHGIKHKRIVHGDEDE